MDENKEFCECCLCYTIDINYQDTCLNYISKPEICPCINCLIKCVCDESCEKFMSFSRKNIKSKRIKSKRN